MFLRRTRDRVEFKPARSATSSRQSGFIIVAVIWLAGLIAALAANFAIKVRIDALSSAHALRNAQVEAIADGMARLTAWRLAAGTYKATLNGNATFCAWRTGVTVEIRVQDQAGLIDLNALPPQFFELFFKRLGAGPAAAESLARAMIDFRDADNDSQSGGSEPSLYSGFDFGPKNAPFQAIEELDQLPGMTDLVYRAVLPFVTVFAAQPGIDPTTMPEALRRLFDQPPAGPLTGELASYNGAPQGKTLGIDVRVTAANGARFGRQAMAVILRQPDKPFSFLEWQRGGDWEGEYGAVSEACVGNGKTK